MIYFEIRGYMGMHWGIGGYIVILGDIVTHVDTLGDRGGIGGYRGCMGIHGEILGYIVIYFGYRG